MATEGTSFSDWLTTKVRTHRDEHGRHIRQKDLARAIGVSAPHVSKLTTGERHPTYDMAIRIAQYFGEDLNFVLILAELPPVTESIELDSNDPLVLRILSALRQISDNHTLLNSAAAAIEGLAYASGSGRKNSSSTSGSKTKR